MKTTREYQAEPIHYSTRGERIKSPLLTEKQKSEEEVANRELPVLEPGERGIISALRKIDGRIRRKKLVFDYEDHCYSLYIECAGKEMWKMLHLYYEQGMVILADIEMRPLFSTAVKEVGEIFDFLGTAYNNKYKNGQLVTRDMVEEEEEEIILPANYDDSKIQKKRAKELEILIAKICK